MHINEDQDEQAIFVYVEELYNNTINYYWKSARINKRKFLYLRSSTIYLGSLATFSASVSGFEIIKDNQHFSLIFLFATPIITLFITIVQSLFDQSRNLFWWKISVQSALTLQNYRDNMLITKFENRDFEKDLSFLNNLVKQETEESFQLGAKEFKVKEKNLNKT